MSLVEGHVEYYGLATSREDSPPFEVALRKGHGVFHAGLELHKARPQHLADYFPVHVLLVAWQGSPDNIGHTAQPHPVVQVQRNQARNL